MFNKKGDERVLSLYWFIIFIIVAIGLVSGVLLFFSNPLDVREVEANLLADKVILCFSENGVLQNANNVGDCNLILDEEEFFVEVFFEERIVIYSRGDDRFRAFCGHEGSQKNIPICVRKSLFVLAEEGYENYVKLDVTAAVRKLEENQK